MFAISFEINAKKLEEDYVKEFSQVYIDINSTLNSYGFNKVHNNLYICEKDDLVNLYDVITELKELKLFSALVKDVKVFKAELWSDFTSFMLNEK